MTASVSAAPQQERRRPGTLSAFRSRNFRLYFGGQLISMSGSWMQIVAQGWLVFNLTKSELWLGIVSLAAGLPSLLLSPFAGVLVERISRHKVIIVTQTAQMLLAFILAALTFNGTVQVWHVVLLSFLLGATNAVDAPARQALIADIVSRDDLSSGISLSSTMYNASRVLGPSAAGVALVQFGPAWCFFINGVTFLAVLASLFAMRVEARMREVGGFAPFLQLKEGLAFSAKHATIAPLLLLATIGAVFSFNITTLFPAFADTALNSPKEGFAALSAANGLGAVLAAVLVTTLTRRVGRGRIITMMGLLGPVLTFLLATSSALPVAMVWGALAGFCVILQFVTMNTTIQNEVPDGFRARVMSLYTLTFFGIAPFAAVGLGAFAQSTSTASAIALCGVCALILNAIVLVRSEKLRATF